MFKLFCCFYFHVKLSIKKMYKYNINKNSRTFTNDIGL